jgi:hypothetical protein
MKGQLDTIQKQLDHLTKSLQKNTRAPEQQSRPRPVRPNGGRTYTNPQYLPPPSYADILQGNPMFPMFPNPWFPHQMGNLPFDGTRGKPPYQKQPFRSKDISGRKPQTQANPKVHKDKSNNSNNQSNANKRNKGNAPVSERNPQR